MFILGLKGRDRGQQNLDVTRSRQSRQDDETRYVTVKHAGQKLRQQKIKSSEKSDPVREAQKTGETKESRTLERDQKS